MKKLLKGIGILAGSYAVLEVLYLAFIGYGRVCQYSQENPEEGPFEAAGNVLEDAKDNIFG